MRLQRLRERIQAFKNELEQLIEDRVRQKIQEEAIPSEEQYRSLLQRIEELEKEKERLQQRENLERKRPEPPQVPSIEFERAACQKCSRPVYRMGYCLYHFEQQYLGE